MRARAFVFFLVGTAGCAKYDPDHDAKIPGDLLGTYAVQGRLQKDECRAEVLGALDPWNFDLKLSRFERDLYWLNGREAIVGSIDGDDKTFHFSTRVDVDVTAAGKGKDGCTLSRYDTAEGELSATGTDVRQMSANLSFEYRAKSGSDCEEIIGISSGFARLPCRLVYALTGSRTSAPESP